MKKQTGPVRGSGLWTILILVLILAFAVSAAAAEDTAPLEMMEDNTFWYGHFEQDNNLVNGKEPILWRVLDVDWEHEYFLAMSEYGLYTMNYHHSNSRTAWADTDVRDWLNHAFASAAFTVEERRHIAITEVSGSMDRFFLLNPDQVQKYLKEPYLCPASAYAISCGAYVNEKTQTSSWLLRTDVAAERIAWVGGGGKLYLPTGSKGVNYLTSGDNVVRPVMWISLSEINDGEIVDYVKAEPTQAPVQPKQEDGLWAYTLDSTIATRSGPSTGYNGIGNYENVDRVKVISRASDGSIMWLEVEFPYNGLIVRCYTGLKRVNVDVNIVPDDPASPLFAARVIKEGNAYYGPGRNYKKQVDIYTPSIGTPGQVLKQENGWYCFQYEVQSQGKTVPVRVWLPEEDVEAE